MKEEITSACIQSIWLFQLLQTDQDRSIFQFLLELERISRFFQSQYPQNENIYLTTQQQGKNKNIVFLLQYPMRFTKIIGPIQIQETHTLGSGSAASVFKGSFLDDSGKLRKTNYTTGDKIFCQDIQLAVKVVPHYKRYRNQVTKYLFESQKQALTTLNHTNILKCFGVFEDGANTYLATQYIKGGSLKEFIARKEKISEKQAISFLKKLLQGLSHMANQGYIHRDLKPANIMIRKMIDLRTNQRIIDPVIIDFGFAERINYKWKPQIFYNVGSSSYMAPESFKLTKYSPKSDLWALGVIFFEMLTGDSLHFNIGISNLFNFTAQVVEKKLTEKKCFLSSQCMKILQSILIANENDRPDVSSILALVSQLDETYKFVRINKQLVPVNKQERKLTTRLIKNQTERNLFQNPQNYKAQVRQRVFSFTNNHQLSDRGLIDGKTINHENLYIPITVLPQKQIYNLTQMKSERLLTTPAQFIEPRWPSKKSDLQKIYLIERKGQIINVNKVQNKEYLVRQYHPSSYMRNPEITNFNCNAFDLRPVSQFSSYSSFRLPTQRIQSKKTIIKSSM